MSTNKSIKLIIEEGVKRLGAFMQQVRIEMKRTVHLGLYIFKTVSGQNCVRD